MADKTADFLLMTECDTLLMVGSSFPYSEFLPEEGQARGIPTDQSDGIMRWDSTMPSSAWPRRGITCAST